MYNIRKCENITICQFQSHNKAINSLNAHIIVTRWKKHQFALVLAKYNHIDFYIHYIWTLVWYSNQPRSW